MFAKVFSQILDSSLAEDYQTRHVFEDFLKLCDVDGVVDVTHEAIARRTNSPLEVIRAAIEKLEQPDPSSRNPTDEGRRIVRLDNHRNWGWIICNYAHYRAIASEEQRREKTRLRVEKHRAKKCVTLGNASNAMQREMEKEVQNLVVPLSVPVVQPKKRQSDKALNKAMSETALRFEKALGDSWVNDAGKWVNRIKGNHGKSERVVAEVCSAIAEGRINTSPAQYAEQIWKEFK